MMRIGLFPLWIGSQTKVGGIATYDTELLPALAEAAPRDEFHIYSSSKAQDQVIPLRPNIRYHQLHPASHWISVPVSFPLAIAFSRLQLVHTTYVPPPFCPKPYLLTLHCCSTFTHPEFSTKALNLRVNALLRRGMRSARMVLCVSKGLRDWAETELKISPDRLAVAYHGVSQKFSPVPKQQAWQRVQAAFGLAPPYMLFVGVIGPRKNVVRIVEAFDLYRQETRSAAKLVMVGRKWIAQEVDEVVRQRGLSADVIHLGNVETRWLADLYSGAELLVFPSLWESFGLPIIESMACGTPVLTSRGSCIPEIAGDAAVLVDPLSVRDIAEGMARILSDTALAEDLRQKGLQRARMFTWKNSAVQTLAAYRQAIGA